MQIIPKDDSGVRFMQAADQAARTAMENRRAERQMALQRFSAFRSLGDSKRAAEELNKAQGKGLLARMFGNNYNKPEDFDVAGPGLANQMMGARPEVAEDDKMQIAMQAANIEMDRQGGYGGALTKEMKSGYGPRAAALAAKNVQGPEQISVSGSPLTADVDQYTSPKAVAAQKRVLQVENSQQKYDSMKMSNMQSRPLSPDATDQYDFFKQQYDAALATGKQGLIKDAYNDMVHKFKMLDNKFGWNMSSGLASLRPTFGGGGGGGKRVLWKERGSERKQYLPEGQVPKDSENWVPIDSEDSSAMRRDLVKLDDQIAAARSANDEKTLSTLMARRRQLEGKTPETKQNFVARMDNSLINPYLAYTSGENVDTGNIADNTPVNKNQPAAQPKIKYKEGYEYEVNGQRMVYQNGRLRKL